MMQNYIKAVKPFSIPFDSHILFDSDVLIDAVKLRVVDEFKDIFKDITKCILNSTKIEILNTRDKTEFMKLIELTNGYWQFPLLARDFLIADKLQEYNTRLSKCPALGDYLLASKLISFGGKNIFVLTGNIQDFSGEIFDCKNIFDVYSNGSRKLWGLLGRSKKYNDEKKAIEDLTEI